MQHEKPAQMPLEGGIEEGRARCDTKFQEGRARCDTKFQVCENWSLYTAPLEHSHARARAHTHTHTHTHTHIM